MRTTASTREHGSTSFVLHISISGRDGLLGELLIGRTDKLVPQTPSAMRQKFLNPVEAVLRVTDFGPSGSVAFLESHDPIWGHHFHDLQPMRGWVGKSDGPLTVSL